MLTAGACTAAAVDTAPSGGLESALSGRLAGGVTLPPPPDCDDDEATTAAAAVAIEAGVGAPVAEALKLVRALFAPLLLVSDERCGLCLGGGSGTLLARFESESSALVDPSLPFVSSIVLYRTSRMGRAVGLSGRAGCDPTGDGARRKPVASACKSLVSDCLWPCAVSGAISGGLEDAFDAAAARGLPRNCVCGCVGRCTGIDEDAHCEGSVPPPVGLLGVVCCGAAMLLCACVRARAWAAGCVVRGKLCCLWFLLFCVLQFFV